jgi:DNA-binding transcriptional LysR family regulator
VTEGEVFDPTNTEKVFRLSMNDMMESMLLPKLLARLQEEAPQLGLECYLVKRNDIERELAAGTLDFALDIPVVASPQVCAEPMASNQRYACVVRKDHPFIGDTLTLDDYLSLDHLQVSSRRKGGSYEDVALNRLGRQRHIRMRVQHYRVAPLLIAVSDMALTIPMELALTLDLKVLELPFSTAPLGTNLYWHKSADHDKANQWMRELIREIY